MPEAVCLQNDRPLRIDPNRGYSPARTTLKVLNDIYEFRAAPSNAPLAIYLGVALLTRNQMPFQTVNEARPSDDAVE